MSEIRALNPELRVPTPEPRAPQYACLFLPPDSGRTVSPSTALLEIAQAFSPRYEIHRDDLISMDVTGLERLMGIRRSNVRPQHLESRAAEPRAPRHESRVGDELMRALRANGLCGHVALAGTRVAALVLAHARPGLTVIAPGDEARALASVPIDVLAPITALLVPPRQRASKDARQTDLDGVKVFTRWALRTLGDLAALPASDLMSRLGRPALLWQAIARGEDVRPLVPSEPEERFEGSLELDWPIEGLEPLSFVLTRLLEPLSTRLERRDRGAAVLHLTLDLVTREVHARHLQLPSPLRDVRTLRTLALLDIEAHPPASAVDRVTIVIDPTPGRVIQHTLFTRTLPTPERLSTLLARLGAVMGQDRVGAPVAVDTHRPGAFAMRPFSTEHRPAEPPPTPATRRLRVQTGLRRCRQPVPARVVVRAGRPVRVTSDRQGFVGGSVIEAAGPWRTSGQWWEVEREGQSSPALDVPGRPWDRDEWDVMLADGARYRVFCDRATEAWYIEGIFD